MPHSREVTARQFAFIGNPDRPGISIVTESNVHLFVHMTPHMIALATIEFEKFNAAQFEKKYEAADPEIQNHRG